MERVLLCMIEILSNNINNVSGETDMHSLLEDRKSNSCQLEIKAELQCEMKLEMHVERSTNGVKSRFKGQNEAKFKKKLLFSAHPDNSGQWGSFKKDF